MTPQSALSSAISQFEASKEIHLNALKELIRIPSVSFPGFDPAPVRTSAGAVLDLLQRYGLKDARVLETEGGHPAVFGQWTGAPGRPTVLLYAHHDVQPTGRDDLWTTPPFEPEVREGRLYGRGSADDKGGIMMHAAAVYAWLTGPGSLPVNVKILIEGEEEVGSSHLGEFLDSHRSLLAADAVLIADSENFASGVPSLTTSLRGIVTVAVEVRSLLASVHSGTWGGPLPDPVLALAKMLSSLVDDDGRPAIPGLHDRVRPMSERDRAEQSRLPFSERTFREQARMIEGAELTGGDGSVYEKLWRLPSIAVNAVEASSRKQAANIINDAAWARVGIRIVPDMDPGETLELLSGHLRKHAPWGVEVTIRPESPSPWWRTGTDGPYFEAAAAALAKGYGKQPALVGAGGSIPFVRTMTDALGGVPGLLFGVGDPRSAAHSENESLLVSDWECACRSVIHLFAEIAERA